jgi:hypothetical protein
MNIYIVFFNAGSRGCIGVDGMFSVYGVRLENIDVE